MAEKHMNVSRHAMYKHTQVAKKMQVCQINLFTIRKHVDSENLLRAENGVREDRECVGESDARAQPRVASGRGGGLDCGAGGRVLCGRRVRADCEAAGNGAGRDARGAAGDFLSAAEH
jgi:hypothetical protein